MGRSGDMGLLKSVKSVVGAVRRESRPCAPRLGAAATRPTNEAGDRRDRSPLVAKASLDQPLNDGFTPENPMLHARAAGEKHISVVLAIVGERDAGHDLRRFRGRHDSCGRICRAPGLGGRARLDDFSPPTAKALAVINVSTAFIAAVSVGRRKGYRHPNRATCHRASVLRLRRHSEET